jgi:hypothetical protein
MLNKAVYYFGFKGVEVGRRLRVKMVRAHASVDYGLSKNRTL